MTEEDEEDYRIKNLCQFCEKILNLIMSEVIVT